MKIPRTIFLLLMLTWEAAVRAENLPLTRVEELRAQVSANFFAPESLPALAAKTHRKFSPAPGVVAEAV